MNDAPSAASRFNEEREKLGLTQAALSAKVGVSKVTISHYACGKSHPSFDVLMKLDALGADVNYIVSGKRTNASIAEPINIDSQRLALAIEAAHKQSTSLNDGKQDFKGLAKKALSIYQAWDFVLTASQHLGMPVIDPVTSLSP
jgi:transcriptional regulator with XRE-family HTH domain